MPGEALVPEVQATSPVRQGHLRLEDIFLRTVQNKVMEGDAVRLEQLAQQASLRGNPAEAKRLDSAARAINGDNALKSFARSLTELEKNNQQDTPQYRDLLEKMGRREHQIKVSFGINDPYVPIANPNTVPETPPASPGFFSMLRSGMTPNFGGGSQPAPRPRTSGAVDPNNPLLRTN